MVVLSTNTYAASMYIASTRTHSLSVCLCLHSDHSPAFSLSLSLSTTRTEAGRSIWRSFLRWYAKLWSSAVRTIWSKVPLRVLIPLWCCPMPSLLSKRGKRWRMGRGSGSRCLCVCVDVYVYMHKLILHVQRIIVYMHIQHQRKSAHAREIKRASESERGCRRERKRACAREGEGERSERESERRTGH